MRALGVLLALFGGGGVATGIGRIVNSRHVEPIGMALLVLIAAGGVLLFWLGTTRARAQSQRVPELAVLRVAAHHHGRVTAVLVAAETQLPIVAAERELAELAERGVCMRRTDDAGAVSFLFPELESEDVKQQLFFSDDQAKRVKRGHKVSS